MITTTFIYPVFSEHLFIKFGLNIETSSIFFVISMISYFLTLQILNKINTRLGVKLTILTGLLINFIMVPFLAPASFLPQNILLVVFGLIILGMTGAFITIPGIVDFMDTMKIKMKLDDIAANDVSSGKIEYYYLAIYNLSINIGEALGPILGGYFTQYYSFEKACTYTGFLCLIYSILFGIFNINTIKHQFMFSKTEISEDENEYKNIEAVDERKESIDNFSYVSKYRAYSFSYTGGHNPSLNMVMKKKSII
jgi:MFS family permease